MFYLLGGKIKIVLFTGGRGNSNLIKAIARRPDIDLTLIINAYDDGLSTGAIRKQVNGLLGPSDFRKNLSHLLSISSDIHLGYSKLLEYRLKEERLRPILVSPSVRDNPLLVFNLILKHDETLSKLVSALPRGQRDKIGSLVKIYLDRILINSSIEDLIWLSDFAFGNILIAGAFILREGNFSQANQLLCDILEVRTKVLNLSDDNLFLIALTDQGEFLESESRIVSGTYSGKISDLYLVTEQDRLKLIQVDLSGLQVHEVNQIFKSYSVTPRLNENVVSALKGADFVIYGSGTLHSSLLPSYKVLSENGISPPSSAVRILIPNLKYDHDIGGWSETDFLEAFRKSWNVEFSRMPLDLIFQDEFSIFDFTKIYPKEKVLVSKLALTRHSDQHDGASTLELIYLLDSGFNNNNVSIAVRPPSTLKYGSRLIYGLDLDAPELDDFSIHRNKFDIDHLESIGQVLQDWFYDDLNSRFLVLYACEGEIEKLDLAFALKLMREAGYAALSGSRIQSRKQWYATLGKTFGEERLSFYLAVYSTIFVSFVTSIRRREILSDPLSRYLILDRYNLNSDFEPNDFKGRTIPGLRTFIVNGNMNVGEFPARYRVYKGNKTYLGPIREAIRSIWEILSI
jgi:2-phospho-L-lactate transferase/gluconeogenesis factor (CofD/UPF0052 family)